MIKNNVRHILLDKNMSMNQLAEATNTAYSTIHRFATGKAKNVNFDVLDRVCEVLEVDICDLFVRVPNDPDRVLQKKLAEAGVHDPLLDLKINRKGRLRIGDVLQSQLPENK